MDTARRRDELAVNLAEVTERIHLACDDAGRDRGEVTLVVVTKTWPASDVALLAELGVHEVAENRDQEAAPKQREVADLDLRWHFIGQLQRNKARSVAGYAGVVESVDRESLARALSSARETSGRAPLEILLQVSLDGETGRGGARPDELAALAELVTALPSLALRGVMAVAPLGEDPDLAFARLAEVSGALRQRYPDATSISAGMSGDLEAAIRHGATHVRVGTAVLGHREPVR